MNQLKQTDYTVDNWTKNMPPELVKRELDSLLRMQREWEDVQEKIAIILEVWTRKGLIINNTTNTIH